MNGDCNPMLNFDHGFKSIGKMSGYGYIYTGAVTTETEKYGIQEKTETWKVNKAL
jgi:hypothetical protein